MDYNFPIYRNQEKGCYEATYDDFLDAMASFEFSVRFRGKDYFISSVSDFGWCVMSQEDPEHDFVCASQREFEETATIGGVPLEEAWPEIVILELS